MVFVFNCILPGIQNESKEGHCPLSKDLRIDFIAVYEEKNYTRT